MARGMTRQRDELHAVDDWLGATKRVPLTGLDVRRCDGLRTLKERLRILRRFSSDFWRQPKVAFRLRDVNIGIWEDALSVPSAPPPHQAPAPASTRISCLPVLTRKPVPAASSMC